MATLAIGLAGAGIGAVTGVGAGAGWLLGTTLGRVLFPEDGNSSSATRLTDLNVTGASYGAAIPRLYGTMRLAGNIIWAGELRSEAVTSSSGGARAARALSEASERYELVFTYDGESVSKYVYDATEYTYVIADFNADFGASEVAVPELSLTLYQLSETIGRGFPATEII